MCQPVNNKKMYVCGETRVKVALVIDVMGCVMNYSP